MAEFFEDFRKYLPKYLSPAASRSLFEELSQFPENIDSRLYSSALRGTSKIFQGDGLARAWICDLPEGGTREARVMVLSNSCDVDLDNRRISGPRLIYCPIVSFSKYSNIISRENTISAEKHLEDIRRQRVTSMFYLPRNDALGEEGIALLDRINNCDFEKMNFDELIRTRLFTLSDYGFYMFLFKLSIHLTRIREGIVRT